MPTTLVTTAGSASANSYVTVEEAVAYIAAMPFTAKTEWADLSQTAQEYRLKLAALWMNAIPYRGVRACLEQRLEFPRWWRTDDGYPDYEDTYADMDAVNDSGYTAPIVSQEVKDAQCEIAFQVVHMVICKATPGASPDIEPSSFTIGSLSMTFSQAVGASLFNQANLSAHSIISMLLSKWERHIGGGVA